MTAKTKACPYCAENILDPAIKCRFCGEYLDSRLVKAVKAGKDPDAEADEDEFDGELEDDLLFAASPSLWGMVSTFIKAGIVIALAIFLMNYKIEYISWLHVSQQYVPAVAKYRYLIGLGIAVLAALVLLLKALQLKMMYYEVSPDRIEFSRGILDRRIDNLDMFRVVDLKLRRSILDCIVDVGTVELVTTDKSDPTFKFEKVPCPRELYDAIKKASLEADRNTGVVHIE